MPETTSPKPTPSPRPPQAASKPQAAPKSSPPSKTSPATPKRRAFPANKRRAALRKKLIHLGVLVAVGISLGLLLVMIVSSVQPKGPSVVVGYRDEIRQAALSQGLEPAYIAAVVMAESSYRPDAVSADNAQGLMQVTPSTAEWIAGKLGETYAEGTLFDPVTNLRYGCWYLAWLMQRYDGDMSTASSAYFQGQGAVDGWLRDPQYSKNGRTLDQPATQATRTYVDRIMSYYEKYKEIYAS